MKFVPTENLKTGMRLAKPIYNKSGVMLYERDSKLTIQGISSIENFGLIGIYVLEQAEPLPPMTEEDREFERFQTMSVFKLKEILDSIKDGGDPEGLDTLAGEIYRRYGFRKDKITFMQNLRSKEDTVYKHSLNVAILAAAISGKLSFNIDEQKNIIMAALIHDVGSLQIPDRLVSKPMSELTDDEKIDIIKYRDEGYRTLRENCDFDSHVMKNVSYLLRDLKDIDKLAKELDKRPKDNSVEVLKVAYMYDTLTAMKLGEEPMSDIAAYKYLKHPRYRMSQDVVRALTEAIHIVPVGCTVQFENGCKGIVLTDNPDDILRPFILSFKDNHIYNLSDGKVYEEYQIKDILKTLDNRYIMTDKYKEYLDKLSSGEEKVINLD